MRALLEVCINAVIIAYCTQYLKTCKSTSTQVLPFPNMNPRSDFDPDSLFELNRHKLKKVFAKHFPDKEGRPRLSDDAGTEKGNCETHQRHADQ